MTHRWIVDVMENPEVMIDCPKTEFFGFENEKEARAFMRDVIAAGAWAAIADTTEK